MSTLLSELGKRCDLSNQMLKQANLFAVGGRYAKDPAGLLSVVAPETTRFAKIMGDQGRQIDAAVGNFKKIGVGLRSDAVWKVFGEDLAKRSLGAAAAQVSDILKKAGGQLQAVWSNTLVSPAIPDLRSILPASIGLDLAQITASLNQPLLGPNHFLHHVLIVASEDSSEEEKIESLGFLREKAFKSGVAKKRRYAHRLRIQAALNDARESISKGGNRSEAGGGSARAWHWCQP